jgi:hypothetical protein
MGGALVGCDISASRTTVGWCERDDVVDALGLPMRVPQLRVDLPRPEEALRDLTAPAIALQDLLIGHTIPGRVVL